MKQISPATQNAAIEQIKLNTRLTALQAALEVMSAPNYAGAVTAEERIAMAKIIETYILEVVTFPENKPTLVVTSQMPPKGAFTPGR